MQCLKKLHYISYISNTVRDIKKFETFRVEGGLSCKAKIVYLQPYTDKKKRESINNHIWITKTDIEKIPPVLNSLR